MVMSNQKNDSNDHGRNTNKKISKNSNETDELCSLFDKCVSFNPAFITTTKKNKKTKKINNEAEKVKSIFSFTEEKNILDLEHSRLNNVTMDGFNADVLSVVTDVNEHSCGDMNKKCSFCGALNFKDEANNKGLFKSCCHFGKVKLQKSKKYPKILKELLTTNTPQAKNFRANIRPFNSALSFASMGAQIEAISNGPYCFKIHGQVYHNTYHMNPINEGDRKYSQLYVVDTSLATDIRLNNPSNGSCDKSVLRELDVLIRDINPYSAAFKNMSEVEKQKTKDGEFIEDISMVFNKNINRDRRRYNSPTVNEIAMVFVDKNGEPPFERDIRVYNKGVNYDNTKINLLSPHLDPMSYVVFFPHGEAGWQPNLMLPSYNGEMQKVSMLQYKIAQLAIKEGEFNPLLYGGKLLQQWIVDSYLQVEANNLNFIKQNQKKLRVDYYKGLVDFVNSGISGTSKPVILPSTFQGSPRNMRERYHDAMSIVTKYGKPDLFITMTCNPNWREIKDNLFDGQTASDRPDLIARVFNIKLKAMLDDILSGKVFGKVVAHVYSIEFQKRGLPHAHILVILKNKIENVSKIDEFVSAEIPSKIEDAKLYENVMKHMIHGPCGIQNPESPCMENGICTKEYPKTLNEKTALSKDGYPLYRRRAMAPIKVKGYNVCNANVVPYNKYLLKKYNCHINVEVCTSIKSVKYIFKYIYKGFDSAEVRITDNNEINQYINSRYVSAPEAMWRLLEFKMHNKSHSIVRLPVHLPREQMIVFEEGKENEALIANDLHQTQLMAWFKLNEEDESARKFLYSEIPLHYTYKKGMWHKRKYKISNTITRIFSVSPLEKERFFLRTLLLNVRGSKSFEDLRTFKGKVYPTFEEAVEAMGLLSSDNEWDRVLEEAVSTQSPSQVRMLFAYICSFNKPKNPNVLFEKFYDDMIEDFKEDINANDRLLSIIKELVATHGWTLAKLGLPNPKSYIALNVRKVVNMCDINEKINSLNNAQKHAFDAIISRIDRQGGLLYLDGPAGSGKTYLYNTLTKYLEGIGKKVIQLATTGIAADLLENGRTVHSGMKLPVPLNETSVSRLQVNSPEAAEIRDASLILIDEVSMMSKFALDAIDEVLRRLCTINKVFGGKTVLLGGDFRQTPNIVLKGSPIDIIENSLMSSRVWRHVKVLRLSVNMRSFNQNMFSDWLLSVGNGSLNDGEGLITIPDTYLEKNDIVESIFGSELIGINDESIYSKVVLTTKNEYANVINDKVLDLIDSPLRVYTSADSIVSDDPSENIRYPTEFLNKQQPSGLPPHKLSMKIGSIIMLLRNLDPRNGLLNGTRLCVKELHDNFIVGQVISGKAKGICVAIPRIDMMPSDTLLPFVMNRRQFPVIVSFAMTIHKAQGQSFEKVGVYLPEPVFTHGQLYVALSRVKNANGLKVFIPSECKNKTRNVVYDELLKGSHI